MTTAVMTATHRRSRFAHRMAKGFIEKVQYLDRQDRIDAIRKFGELTLSEKRSFLSQLRN